MKDRAGYQKVFGYAQMLKHVIYPLLRWIFHEFLKTLTMQ